MKKSATYFFIMILLVMTLPISDSWAFQKEERNLPTFTKIASRSSAHVYFKKGNKQLVVLEGSEDAIKKTVTEVKNGKLVIRQEGSWGWSWGSGDRITVYITVKQLDGISLSGSGKMVGESPFNAENMSVAVSGSGNVKLEANASAMEIKISGSGGINLSGKSKENKVSISGSGSVNALDMETDSYQVSISGSGTCKVNVNSEINSRISGSGSVYYKGNPSKVNNKSSGSGKMRKM